MPGPGRIALFAALLAALFGGGLAVGSTVDPDVGGAKPAGEHGEGIGDAGEH